MRIRNLTTKPFRVYINLEPTFDDYDYDEVVLPGECSEELTHLELYDVVEIGGVNS